MIKDENESSREYFKAIHRKLKRSRRDLEQFFLPVTNPDNIHAIVERVLAEIDIYSDANIIFLPDEISSKDQLTWLLENQKEVINSNDKYTVVVVGGFTQEVTDLLKNGGTVDSIKEYYAHTQCQGRSIQPNDTTSEKAKLYQSLSEAGKKLIILNSISQTSELVGENPADVAYQSALRGHFATTFRKEHIVPIEQQLVNVLQYDDLIKRTSLSD